VRRMGPPGGAGLFAQRGHVPFGLKEGRACCTTPNGLRREEERRQKKGEKTRKINECGTRVQMRERERHFAPLPPIPSAVGLLGVAHGPSRRGWTLCPARARPSCIIRGACPLHDLEEVREKGEVKT
jgi:hypothetical protein